MPVILCAALVLAAPPAVVPAAPAASSAAAPTEAALRRELEQAYEKNRQALLARDWAGVIALRTADFAAVTPDGTVHGAEEMAAASRAMLGNIEKWDALSFDILSVEPTRDGTAAEVRQHSIRVQRRDGAVRRIENWVTQRETWRRTGEGWRIAGSILSATRRSSSTACRGPRCCSPPSSPPRRPHPPAASSSRSRPTRRRLGGSPRR
jgi:ketosteroid isomerase-like protein